MLSALRSAIMLSYTIIMRQNLSEREEVTRSLAVTSLYEASVSDEYNSSKYKNKPLTIPLRMNLLADAASSLLPLAMVSLFTAGLSFIVSNDRWRTMAVNFSSATDTSKKLATSFIVPSRF